MGRTIIFAAGFLLGSTLTAGAEPVRSIKADGTARAFDIVAARPADTRVLARQVLPATGTNGMARSRIIYLNRDGASLRPGDNNSTTQTSSIVDRPVELGGWDIDDATWNETVTCFRDLYAPFNVIVTDQEPGDAPHIEAMFGGSPLDVGLPSNVAGVSPFTTDCSMIESSIVFTFTDVLNGDPRTVCEVMAQEVAHSFGLDHEMLSSDPMTYLTYLGDRAFKDEMVSCGEYGDRKCGINGSVCRQRQNSVALLTARLGRNPTGAPLDPSSAPRSAGCSAGGSLGFVVGFAIVIPLVGMRRRKRVMNA